MNEKLKKKIRMETIYKALEEGWTVKKNSNRTFEFSRNEYNDLGHSNKNYKRSISSPIIKKFNNE